MDNNASPTEAEISAPNSGSDLNNYVSSPTPFIAQHVSPRLLEYIYTKACHPFEPFVDWDETIVCALYESCKAICENSLESLQQTLLYTILHKELTLMDEVTASVVLLLPLKEGVACDQISSIIDQVRQEALRLGITSSRILALEFVVEAWTDLGSHCTVPATVSSIESLQSSDVSNFLYNFYLLSRLLRRLLSFSEETSPIERLRFEYDLLVYPAQLPQSLFYVSPVLASNSAAILHTCHSVLLLLYYLPLVGKRRIEPSMGLLLFCRILVESICTVLLERKSELMGWLMCRFALKSAVESMISCAKLYASDEAATALHNFLEFAKNSSIRQSKFSAFLFSLQECALQCLQECELLGMKKIVDGELVYWLFRDVRIMTISALLR